MADIELVIKIPEEMYKWVYDVNRFDEDYGVGDFMDLIKEATPLPKGHGELVDISPYKGKVICSHLYSGVKKLIEVDSIEPIIEADRK